jgi:hypothetical protein
MPPIFQVGDRVIVEFGVGSPQHGEVIAVSDHHQMITVRLSEGIMGQGDMPLQWNSENNYELLAGGNVRVLKRAMN